MQIPEPNQHSSSNTVNLEDNSNTNKTEHGSSTINNSEAVINNDSITITSREEDYKTDNNTNRIKYGNSTINNIETLINNGNITITSGEENYKTDNNTNRIKYGNSTIDNSETLVNHDNITITSGKEDYKNNINKKEYSNCELVIYKLQGDYSGIVCKIIEKSYELNKRCLLLCKDEEEVELLDSKLWTYSKLSFIPHGSKYSLNIEDAIYCNTWISDDLVYINNPNYLINLGCAINNIQYDLEKIIHITCNEHDSIDTIKNKYNINFNKRTLWTYYNNKWIKSN